MLAWGRGTLGQLGIGVRKDQEHPHPVALSSDASVQYVVCGAAHSIALTEEGALYSWGAGQRGQLGSGSWANSVAPGAVSGLGRVLQVASGDEHVLAVTETGVYAWGGGRDGQLGTGEWASFRNPVPVPALNGLVIMQVACGTRHSAALCCSG